MQEPTRRSAGYVALSSADGTENELVFLEAGGLPCTVDPSLPMPIRGLRPRPTGRARWCTTTILPRVNGQTFLPEGHVVIDNVLFAPLVVEGQVVGLLGLADKPGGFDDNDAHLAAAFSEATAVALLNSRNLDRLRDGEESSRPCSTSCPSASRSWTVAQRRPVNPALASILDLPQAGLMQGSHNKRAYLRADGTEMPPTSLPATRLRRSQACPGRSRPASSRRTAMSSGQR